MTTFVADLEPRALWAHFDRILATPRPSKQEAAMRAYVREVAATRDLEVREDGAGNLVVAVPASAGREAAPIVVLQSHLDMVCEKNSGVEFDFERQAIVPRRDGDWLYATGTTLGSDNGIGVAAMLALIGAEEVEHGPLELLFTVEEEIGLNGAAALDPALVRGRTLLNLDTEEEGALYVGCAGGAGSELALPIDTMFGVEGRVTVAVRVAGLLGGHSGVDIHLQRGNALAILARLLHPLWKEFQFEVGSITGGNLTNAIPREAEAVIRLAVEDRGAFEKACRAAIAEIRAELAAVDPGLEISFAPAECGPEVWSDATAVRLLALLAALPHGVLRMSDEIPGLVETSTNFARVRSEPGVLQVSMSNRSSVDAALRAVQRRMAAFAELAGGDATQSEGYPGWKPDLASPLLAITRRVHERVLGSEPRVLAIHAGLECGVLGARLGGADMISIGPQIEHPHSPDERVGIASVGGFWRLLTATLTELARPA
jgi:dipeptidase D